MKDILHQVEAADDGFICGTCGVRLPAWSCLTELVAEIAGTDQFIPVMPGDEPRLSCASKAATKAREIGEQLLGVEVDIPDGKEVKTKSLSEVGKMVNRGAWNNFLTMRHQTRPEGLSEDIS